MRYRQVHLDFHTSGELKDIGSKFDKEQFQRMLRLGHVDSITVFSKCHHGYSFHPTEVNEMHPGLSFDLLGEQLKACKEADVKAPVYISAGFDEKDAVRRPDWIVREADESASNTKDFMRPGYHRMCFNTGYLDRLIDEVEEVMQRYDPDGIFMDIAAVFPCYCSACRREMQRNGESILDEEAVLNQAERVYMRYVKRVEEAVRKYSGTCTIFHNGGHVVRGKRELACANTHLELESLPTGGWGYDHFPMSAAYVMNLGLPYLGMTGKFHTTWGEFGGFKHPNALRYETALSLAFGAGCSIGDQLHPTGVMNEATYALIGEAYREVEEKEPWCRNALPCTDVAVLGEEAVNARTADRDTKCCGDTGANRILLEGKYLYTFIDCQCDFQPYKVIILPDSVRVSGELAKRLQDYLDAGGKILATGGGGLRDRGDGNAQSSGPAADGVCATGSGGMAADGESFALDFGARYLGHGEYRPDYYVPAGPAKAGTNGLGGKALPDTAYVMYGQGHRIKAEGGIISGKRRNPYFNRTLEHFSSHQHTPDDPSYEEEAVIRTQNTSYIGWEIFSDYFQTGSLHLKKIVRAELDYLLSQDKTLEAALPDRGVVTLTRQREKNRYVVHLLFAHTTIRGYFGLGEEKLPVEVIEDIAPLEMVSVSLKLPEKATRVALAPQGEEIPFEDDGERISFVVPRVDCHQMVAVEYAE